MCRQRPPEDFSQLLLSTCQVQLEEAQEEELITVDAVGCFEEEEEEEEEKEEQELEVEEEEPEEEDTNPSEVGSCSSCSSERTCSVFLDSPVCVSANRDEGAR